MKAIWVKLQHVFAFCCALCLVIALNTSAHAQFDNTHIRAVDADATGANDGTSWEDAFTDLQDALDAMDPGGNPVVNIIWVAEGTYTPSEFYFGGEAFVLISAAKTYGGFVGTEINLAERDPETNITILSGDLNGDDGDATSSCCWPHVGTGCDDLSCEIAVCAVDPYCCDVAWDALCAALGAKECGCNMIDNPFRFVWAHNVDATTVLSGFTIMRGSLAEFPGLPLEGSNGGGMVIVSASPRVTRCVFTENNADDAGGVYVVDPGDPSQPIFANCSFVGNASFESGGGMAILVQREATEVRFVNCVFSRNAAREAGGGIFASLGHSASSATLTNCTFSGNRVHQTEGDGGGFALLNGSATLANCILWGDSPDEISGSSVTVTYSDIAGGWAGDGNINLDPLFCDAANHNLRLGIGSPCVNAANNSDLPNDVADVDDDPTNNGDPIPWDLDKRLRVFPDTSGTVDMGAYENQNDQLCPADLDGDCSVGASDLLLLLASWGPCPGCAADLDCNLVVGASDLLILLASWGLCPCGTGPEPPSLKDELDDACLSDDHWDDFLDKMETGSSAQQENYICWLTHYFEDCTRCLCIGASGCPGPDPFN